MKRKHESFGVIDAFLILLVVVCAAGVAVRYILTDERGILATTPEKTQAAVQVLITGIENTSSDFFSEGGVFTVGECAETGEIRDVYVTPAEYLKEDEDGELVVAYQDGENGKRDVRCTVIVSGYEREGIFMLGGQEPILSGASITLSADGITVSALIIDSAPLE